MAWRQATLAAVPEAENSEKDAAERRANVQAKEADGGFEATVTFEAMLDRSAEKTETGVSLSESSSPGTRKSVSRKSIKRHTLSGRRPTNLTDSNANLSLTQTLRAAASSVPRCALPPDESMTEKEIAWVQKAVKRYQAPHSSDMHKDYLKDFLRYLGYIATSDEQVMELAGEVVKYSEMDSEEVLTFVERYAEGWHSKLKEAFKVHAVDGELATHDVLRKMMVDVGYMPHRAALDEAVHMVTGFEDTRSTLGEGLTFNEFLEVLVAYRGVHGFSGSELVKLKASFESFESAPLVVSPKGSATSLLGGNGLRVHLVVDALTHVFGTHAEAHAVSVIARMHGGDGLCRTTARRVGAADTIAIDEFVTLARCVREAEQDSQSAIFRGMHEERVQACEVRCLMQQIGYEPLDAVIQEVLEDLGIEEDGTLDFNDFFHFVQAFKECDGLPACEVEMYEDAFQQFDTDDSGCMDVIELGNVMRNLGYNLSHADLHLLSDRMDVNRSGRLEMPEFLRMMGAHREADIKRLRVAFDEYVPRELAFVHRGLLPQNQLFGALENVTDGLLPKQVKKAVKGWKVSGATFDEFVGLADDARRINLEDRRRNAGFKEAEVRYFRRIFVTCDKDGSGDIDASEITGLLLILGMKIRTREEQHAVMNKLDEARDFAAAAGVKEVTAKGSANFGFWELVQLMRMLKSDSDKASDELVMATAQELGFPPTELEQFRKIFIKWSREDALDGTMSPESSPVRRQGSKTSPVRRGSKGPSNATATRSTVVATSVDLEEGPPPEEGLSTDALCALLKSMGMSMTLTQKGALEKQVAKVETTEGGLLSLVGFLRMMRWLLDSDFAGINGAAADAVQRNKVR